MSGVKKEYSKGEYSKHLRNFINNTLKEDGLSSYELSRIMGCSETVLGSFLKGGTKTLNSGTVVELAKYKNASLDEVLGRKVKESLQEVKVKNEKDQNIFKKDEQKIPAFLSKLAPEAQQSLMAIREDAKKFKYNSTSNNKEPSGQHRKPFKPTERTR
ncbi:MULTISPECIES: helix-turn-helix transcriptional regulator [unclassified Rickettsia]|uniref:helix-turn-helix domain-containing protein n=1 Tax=unclassified Rickettsia TaxID=114295 RepID=UPI0031331DEF